MRARFACVRWVACAPLSSIGVPAEKRADFAPFHVPAGGETEELLQQHEDELARLRALAERRDALVKHVEKREEIVAERAELDALLKDSSRLTGRGRHSAANLARETAMGKRTKKLPELTERLREKLVEWEAEEVSASGVRVGRLLLLL